MGYYPSPFKKGPDFIDPLWLSRAADRPCYNLDFYISSARRLYPHAVGGHSEGIILRAIGDVLAVCPPLIITEDEINELFDRFERTLDKGLEAII